MKLKDIFNEHNLQPKRGEYIKDAYDNIGVINKVKGRVAYVKFPDTNSSSFEPILVDDLKDGMTMLKGKKLYISENKVECPKCGGVGCSHCNDKGYHLTEGRPMPQDEPNEFWYIDFTKWLRKSGNMGELKKALSVSSTGKKFKALESIWYKWAYKNKPEAKKIVQTGGAKFGKALFHMLKKDKLSEAYQKDGHKYNTEEVGEYNAMTRNTTMDKAFVGKDGILGVNNVFISWSEIKRLQKKYRE